MFKQIDVQSVQGPRAYQEDRYLYTEQMLVVVDGMGGHERGDEAAQAAIDSIGLTPQSAADMRNMLIHAGAAVLALGAGGHRSPGAVIVAAVLVGDELIVGWSGDSRVYVRGVQVTDDHAHADGSIYQCLGAGVRTEPAVITVTVATGDIVVVASDGMNRLDAHEFDDGDLLQLAIDRKLYDNTNICSRGSRCSTGLMQPNGC